MELPKDNIYYEETGTYFHNGTLASKESKLMELIKPYDEKVFFEKKILYIVLNYLSCIYHMYKK